MHGIGFTLLEGPATYNDVLEYYRPRIHLVPRLRQKLAFVPYNVAHPRWVDDPDFQLENHIQPYRCPPGTSYEDAIQLALELGEPLLDRSRPLWLTYVMEGLDGDRTLLAQMSHHAFVDGATAVAIAIALTDPSPDADPPPAEEFNPAPVPGDFQLWQEAMGEQAAAALQVFQRRPPEPALAAKAAQLTTRIAQPVMQAPFNAGLVGPKRDFRTFSRQLDEFKPIRKAFGGTINDVVVTCVTEGVARYMQAKNEPVDNQELRLMCPVDVRDENDDPLKGGGNRVSAMFPILSAAPLGVVERYKEVSEEFRSIKERGDPEILDAIQQLQLPVPPVAMTGTLAVGTALDPSLAPARMPQPVAPNVGFRPFQSGFNFTCTNVPGPTWTQYVAGYRVLSAYGTLMLGGNLGLGTSVTSYDGTMAFCFTADPNLVPDLDVLSEEVSGVFDELASLASAEAGPATG